MRALEGKNNGSRVSEQFPFATRIFILKYLSSTARGFSTEGGRIEGWLEPNRLDELTLICREKLPQDWKARSVALWLGKRAAWTRETARFVLEQSAILSDLVVHFTRSRRANNVIWSDVLFQLFMLLPTTEAQIRFCAELARIGRPDLREGLAAVIERAINRLACLATPWSILLGGQRRATGAR